MTIRRTLSLLLLFIATHALAQQEFSFENTNILEAFDISTDDEGFYYMIDKDEDGEIISFVNNDDVRHEVTITSKERYHVTNLSICGEAKSAKAVRMLRVEGMECPELRDQKDPYVFYPKRSYTFEGDMTGKIEIKFCVYKGQTFNLKSIKFNGNKDAGVKFATESIELNQGETQLLPDLTSEVGGVNFESIEVEDPSVIALYSAHSYNNYIDYSAIALKPGTTNVIAHYGKYDDYQAGTATLKVTVKPVDVAIDGEPVNIKLDEAGMLREKCVDLDVQEITNLIVSGPVNSEDLAYIRSKAGRMANLQSVDLSGITLVADGGCYSTVLESYRDVGFSTATTKWYLSTEEREESSGSSNGLGGGNSVTKIYTMDLGGLFADMKTLKRVVLPEGLPRVGKYLCDNSSVVSITVPQTVERIGEKAFRGCKSLVCHNIPAVKEIGEYAFENAAVITLDLSRVEKIGYSAFSGSYIMAADLSNVDSIPENTFIQCYVLSDLKLSDKLYYVGRSAFRSCESLGSVVLPESLGYIGVYAFLESGLKNIESHLPAACEIERDAFYGTPWYETNAKENEILYLGNAAIKYYYKNNPVVAEKWVLREGTENIANGMVSNGSSDNYANLKTIVLPSTIKRIGEEFCPVYVEKCDLPDGIEIIGSNAFSSTKLKSVTVPASVRQMGNGAFAKNSSLISVVYNASGEWEQEYYAKGVFESCTGLEKVTIGKDVKFLPEMMFAGCSALVKLNFEAHSALESIGDYAFSGCTALKSISLPYNLRYVGNNAFKGCKLKSIYNYMPVPYGFTDERSNTVISWITKDVTVYVLPQYLETYKADPLWGSCNIQPMDDEHIALGIGSVAADGGKMPAAVYDLNGNRIQSLQKGLNIVRQQDGSVVKIYK
ncbi:leucine-rich repeat domain-containing protein [Prevotella sp.]|uniref:leucine-rich repeat domain-containing protein n=1 Tax=Prevotella sp. TaxID=59823 RepID=UPI003FD6FEED